MKNALKTLTGALGVSAFLVALPAFADQPGKGWDTFNTGAGEAIAVHQSAQKSGGSPGKGWDTFQTGAGEPVAVHQANGAKVSMAAGKGWDTFRTGAGQPLPQ
ncbi:MAG: hypothetical protein ROZ09_11905 [Thiobacillus sp.]|jgi:hypothetical protein|uniref:hypothetical protein n=1 Tax=Thiobacillus sp. TaxID=924 RepID=UPI002893E122|nr:hypothetical protein [Thiobacillus sp.]MDT3707523.1 hypothetical protein [Thiobacillus sp.]